MKGEKVRERGRQSEKMRRQGVKGGGRWGGRRGNLPLSKLSGEVARKAKQKKIISTGGKKIQIQYLTERSLF